VKQVDAFLRMQFRLQHTQYIQKFSGAEFGIILVDETSAGRLYVERKKGVMHIIDIALLTEFRRQGIGGRIIKELLDEADANGLALCLHVELNNPILPFYRSIGLREMELRGVYYYMEREPVKRAEHT